MPDLLFELRCEELPPRDLPEAARSLAERLAAELEGAGLAARSTSTAWSPRRIAVWAHGIPESAADREERLNGPKLKAAFDADGRPTKAAEGFAKKAGVPVDALERDGEQVFAMRRTPGRRAMDVAAEVLPKLPSAVKWKKTMRWGGPVEFARPIRGVVALLGGDVVACTVAGIAAGRATHGHPFLAPGEFVIESASREEYLTKLRKLFVLADPEERRAAVLASARKIVHGLEVRDALLEEVTNLVEWPTALEGRFDERFRELPSKLLVTVMEHHQRFFPVRTPGVAGVEARFVAVLDREADSVQTARRGFERVLVPRLHDASFFFAEDRKKRLADREPALENVTYHKKLGSVRDRVQRLRKIARGLAERMGLDAHAASHAERAAGLAKCDLVTLLVGEFPELQGYVGSEYARHDGEPAAVCDAIATQYVHDFDGVALSQVQLCVVLAENLDVLCQFGAKVGLPTGSTDPFGVRRAAITILEACERFARELDLPASIEAAGGDKAVWEYFGTRLRQRLRDEGFRHDHLDAIVAWRSVGEVRARLGDLAALASDASFNRLLEVAERCRNITKKADTEAVSPEVQESLLVEPAEQALFAVWFAVHKTLPPAGKPLSRADVARVSVALADPLHRFFADVFVNADDPKVRGNRLALLRHIDQSLLRFADLCRIERV